MVEPHIVKAASFLTTTHVVASNQSVGCGSAICPYPGWSLAAVADKQGEEAFIIADLNLDRTPAATPQQPHVPSTPPRGLQGRDASLAARGRHIPI